MFLSFDTFLMSIGMGKNSVLCLSLWPFRRKRPSVKKPFHETFLWLEGNFVPFYFQQKTGRCKSNCSTCLKSRQPSSFLEKVFFDFENFGQSFLHLMTISQIIFMIRKIKHFQCCKNVQISCHFSFEKKQFYIGFKNAKSDSFFSEGLVEKVSQFYDPTLSYLIRKNILS